MNKFLITIITFYYFYIIWLLLYSFKKKKNAAKNNQVSFKYFKTFLGDPPEDILVIQNHINNQFQMPVLFFIACILSMQQDHVNVFTLVLALGFVLSRLYHSYIHLGSNHLMKRASSYFIGTLIIGSIFLQNVYLSFCS